MENVNIVFDTVIKPLKPSETTVINAYTNVMANKIKKKKANKEVDVPSNQVPIWKKYALSVEEAAVYFRIGEGCIRKIIKENREAGFIMCNGNRVLIKRKKFEEFLDSQFYIDWRGVG